MEKESNDNKFYVWLLSPTNSVCGSVYQGKKATSKQLYCVHCLNSLDPHPPPSCMHLHSIAQTCFKLFSQPTTNVSLFNFDCVSFSFLFNCSKRSRHHLDGQNIIEKYANYVATNQYFFFGISTQNNHWCLTLPLFLRRKRIMMRFKNKIITLIN